MRAEWNSLCEVVRGMRTLGVAIRSMCGGESAVSLRRKSVSRRLSRWPQVVLASADHLREKAVEQVAGRDVKATASIIALGDPQGWAVGSAARHRASMRADQPSSSAIARGAWSGPLLRVPPAEPELLTRRCGRHCCRPTGWNQALFSRGRRTAQLVLQGAARSFVVVAARRRSAPNGGRPSS